MISVYQIKPYFQALLKPLMVGLHKIGWTPNLLTLLGILLSFGLGAGMYLYHHASWMYLILPIGLFIRMMLNALDGMMAKTYQLETKIGAYLNEMGDIVSDTAIFYPMYLFFEMKQEWVLLFILLSIINEITGILGFALIKERRYDGPMGKSDRALVIGLLSLLCFFEVPIRQYCTEILIIACLLVIWSTIKRCLPIFRKA
ncbi:MAG: CDP-alcohol phosphatidyltransferase family protein [Flavobacteriales bacterium]